jgi:hypothetical protein
MVVQTGETEGNGGGTFEELASGSGHRICTILVEGRYSLLIYAKNAI